MADLSRRISQTLAAAVLLAAGIAVAGATAWAEATHEREHADTAGNGRPSPRNVFQAFVAGSLERTLMQPILGLFAKHQYGAAERVLRALAEKYPQLSLFRYKLAAAQSRLGMTDAALDNLHAAIDLGFSNKAIFERDPDLESLRGQPRFKTLLMKLDAVATEKVLHGNAPPSPARVSDRRARVEESNTRLESGGAILISRFEFAPKPSLYTVHSDKKPFAAKLDDLFRAGKAAGNNGDLYDNRDRGHSDFGRNVMPQVSHIEYGAAAKAAGLDLGANPGLLFNAITFGNSSTAISHQLMWRSQARLILTTPNLTSAAYLQYLNNHIYVYPEHRDHDSENGDLMPANTPYMVVSQGSSGSDQPFLNAIGVILAALQPRTKAFVRHRRLVAPTVQMLLRRGQKWVQNDADYLSGPAHPSAFSAKGIDLSKLIDLANGLNADVVPPPVHLAVVEDDRVTPGVDYFGPPSMNETLFDTPHAIARIVRSSHYWNRLVVSAEKTRDPNGRPLRFRWVVLRGDADRIKIKPLDARGVKAEIRVPWHERHPVSPGDPLRTDRVDIGVFADNGKWLSAPSFVAFLFPGDQARTYAADQRIKCIEYDKPGYRERYVDPVIFPARDWRDCYEYDEGGRLLGWNRIRGWSLQRFMPDGAKVTERDAQGRPVRAQRIGYKLEVSKTKRARVVQVPLDQFVKYIYRDAFDRIGTPAPMQPK